MRKVEAEGKKLNGQGGIPLQAGFNFRLFRDRGTGLAFG